MLAASDSAVTDEHFEVLCQELQESMVGTKSSSQLLQSWIRPRSRCPEVWAIQGQQGWGRVLHLLDRVPGQQAKKVKCLYRTIVL